MSDVTVFMRLKYLIASKYSRESTVDSYEFNVIIEGK